jgi:glycosyltransferase involved in cell wall biosynthesis
MRIQGLLTDNPVNIMGGMGEQLKNNLKHIDRKYHFDIIGCDSSNEYSGDNYNFKSLNNFFSIYSGRIDPLFGPFVNQNLFIEKSLEFPKPDIIHSFDWSTFMPAMFLAKHYKVPLICTIQLSIIELVKSYNIDPYASPLYKLHEAIEIEGLTRADAIIQVSYAYAKNTSKIFWPKTYVIENGIELDEWQQKNKIKLPGENKYKVVFIGRLEYQKNIQTILELNIPEGIDLIIIGGHKGSAPELEDKVIQRSNRDKNFIYVGPKYDQEKIDYFFAADAVLMPSLHEPFGIVALEALASKNILLSSFVSGMGDFLNDRCAINCGISKESIELALQKFLNLSQGQKNTMIKSGIDVCQNYTWQKSAKKLEYIYNLFNK